MKTIAIIGASYLQRPLVEKAKEMGLRTICFAWPAGAVCKDICDTFYPVSITEKEEILRLCREEQIDGICTIASDVAAPTVAYVAEQMGLTGNSYEASLRAHDKYAMRVALSEAGVECPKFTCVNGMSGLEVSGLEVSGLEVSGLGVSGLEVSGLGDEGMSELVLSELSFPLIVKPTDRSGSLAVTKVEKNEELLPAVKKALEVSMAHEAMIEEYIEGREISVEMISCRGTHYALQITDKETTGAPHFVELAHRQPSDLPAAMQEHIYAITRRALDALGLTEGASHSEYKITDEGRIVVMEIGGRMGGDFIGSDLVRLSTGYDFVQGVIEVALGNIIHPEPKPLAHSRVVFDAPENVSCSAERTGYRIYQDDKLVFSV